MHFIAMLAVCLPVQVNYNFVETMLSLYIAIMGTCLGVYLVSRRRLRWASVPVAGLLMGAAIGGMHYLGMNAMRGAGLGTPSPAHHRAHHRRDGLDRRPVVHVPQAWHSGNANWRLMLGLTISSMHYTAMVSTGFDYLPINFNATAPLLSPDALAFIIASSTFTICGIFPCLFSWPWPGRRQPPTQPPLSPGRFNSDLVPRRAGNRCAAPAKPAIRPALASPHICRGTR
jgi:diguanylate cyclase